KAAKPKKAPAADTQEDEDSEVAALDDVFEQDGEELGPGDLADEDVLDLDDLPDGVFVAERVDEALSQAQQDSMGVVHVYGAAVGRMIRWLDVYEQAEEEGAPLWNWVLHVGDEPGKLSFQRYAKAEEAWSAVWETTTEFDSTVTEEAVTATMLQVFDGFVPSLDKRVEFGAF
ncbi:MAG TPA: hypothetical protein DIU15_16370, partial [Deltaproteobacteria bacterium]|nr:hypothetical protein [Deltaproteobacteria bacterium]